MSNLHNDTLRAIVNSNTVSAGDEIKVSIASELLEKRNQILTLTRDRDKYAKRHSDLGVLYLETQKEHSSLIDLFLEWDELTDKPLDEYPCEEAGEVVERCWDLVSRLKQKLDVIRKQRKETNGQTS